jgi:hypothetical protein
MNRASVLAISHLLALGLGYGAHRAWSGIDRQSDSAPPLTAKQEPASGTISTPGRTTAAAGSAQWSAMECRQAWLALRHSDLPPRELMALREQLIRHWASRDLHAALCAWSDADSLEHDLSNRFGEFVVGHEEEMLEWIKAGDFGADGPVLLRRLLSDTEDRNPDLLEKLRPKLPEGFHRGGD